MSSINNFELDKYLHDIDPDTFLRENTELFGEKLSKPIIKEIAEYCYSVGILEESEKNTIISGYDLTTFINKRSSEEKRRFIKKVCSIQVHAVFRTALETAASKERIKLTARSQQNTPQINKELDFERANLLDKKGIENLEKVHQTDSGSILGFLSNHKKVILIIMSLILGSVLAVGIIFGIFLLFSSQPNHPTQAPIFPNDITIPEEFTESHLIVYPKTLKPDPNLLLSFDPPPIKSIIQIDSFNGASNYKTTCKKGSSTALHLKSEEMLTPSSNPVDIPCPENVHSLELSGLSSIQYLHQVLSLLINLRGIVINATYLCNLEMSSELTTSFIKLEFLDYLKLTNIQGECERFLEYLNTTLNAPNLQRLVFENVEILMDNFGQFHNFFKKNPTVQYFTFYGGLCYNCVIDSSWKNLTGLKWFVHEDVGTSGLDSLKSFIKSRSVQVVQTNVKIGRYLDFFPYSDKLVSLNLTIDLGSNDFDSKFFSKFHNLQEAELKLLSSSSDRTINLNWLQKYVRKMRSLKFSSKNQIRPIGVQTLHCMDFTYDRNGDERVVSITAKDSC